MPVNALKGGMDLSIPSLGRRKRGIESRGGNNSARRKRGRGGILKISFVDPAHMGKGPKTKPRSIWYV